MFNMGISIHWNWISVLLCFLCMGDVHCNCPEDNIQIEGGNFTLTKGLQRDSILVYSCREGYYPYPASHRVCQANDRWNPPPKKFLPQRCRLVECPDPSVLEYGNVFPPQEKYFVDNETTYECYSGYTLRGSSRRVCLKNGKWSGSIPICSHDSGADCADPGIPAGGSRVGNMFGIDDRVQYSCNNNLFLVGSKERVCQESGQWTGTEPSCYYKHTYDTPLEVSAAFGSAIKGSLTTLESTDDTQAGRKIRITKNGTLNIYIAVDISASIEEKYFNQSKNVVIKLMEKIASFSVTPNYEIVFFSSELYEVVNILDFFDSTVSLSTTKSELEKFKIGDRNTGTDLNRVFMTFLERMAVIKRRVGEKTFKEHRHVIILFSDGAYNMGGSPAPTVEQIKNMVYMNHTTEQQAESREDYLDIYVFAIGDLIFDDDLQPLTTQEQGTRHYFRMKDYENLEDMFDEIIDEEDVKGLCGLYREPNTKDDKKTQRRKKYPWFAFVIVQNGEKTKKCIGSLVTRRFVLTAAHCFTFGDLPQHVKVEIDDGQGTKVKKIDTFKLHPDYNIRAKSNLGIQEFYDYDVALIQLSADVQISSVVRPICIPCTQETSTALKLADKSTCKQQEQLLLKNYLERLSFLTREEETVAEKDVHAKIGANRDECIKHALKAPEIPKNITSPEELVTENFLCTGGLEPVRDDVACRGDSGGAVFKNYEQRTIQVALVSWGTRDLCQIKNFPDPVKESRDFHINLFKVVPFLKSILGNEQQDDYAPLSFLEN
ncbi:complement factor B-like [Mugil cephalus]|uniref:complement factor B-like n=1 Tax=Mugil cephalus TaxID=48193 RepID=UPI001FB693A2|nr:complement factor B-like [Mugil cephalus]